jgi:hypothetical protein
LYDSVHIVGVGRSTGEQPVDQASPAILTALRDLVPSAEPAVVLTSLAAATVPAFADECAIALTSGHVPYLIRRPERTAAEEPAAGHELTVGFQQDACGVEPPYAAAVTYRWIHRPPVPSAAVVGRLLLDRAADLVRTGRLAAALAAAQTRAEHLETALHSNREIGQALGILMYSRKLTGQQAFHLIRIISQHTNRKLRDIAAEIVRTGTLPDHRLAWGAADHPGIIARRSPAYPHDGRADGGRRAGSDAGPPPARKAVQHAVGGEDGRHDAC